MKKIRFPFYCCALEPLTDCRRKGRRELEMGLFGGVCVHVFGVSVDNRSEPRGQKSEAQTGRLH